MVTLIQKPDAARAAAGYVPNIGNVHHAAYKCADAEATRHFYEDLLGLELVAVLRFENQPPLDVPFLHIFFRMGDGNCIAFFDLGDGKGPEFAATMPAWTNHIALQVPDEASLQAMWQRLTDAGVTVEYMKDHGFCRSIYMYDPSGNRLEVTTPTENANDFWAEEQRTMRAELARWNAERARVTPAG